MGFDLLFFRFAAPIGGYEMIERPAAGLKLATALCGDPAVQEIDIQRRRPPSPGADGPGQNREGLVPSLFALEDRGELARRPPLEALFQ